MKLPEEFYRRMQERLGSAFPAFLASYETPAHRGLRVNTLKISAEEFLRRAPFPLGDRIPWERDGFYHAEERAGADPYHFAGLYYLQEPSAMCAAALLNVSAERSARVLDLCAAPGGKTVQLAAAMRGGGILVANEIDGARAKILSQNAERMGIRNCAVVSASPERLAALFPHWFDAILVDAPCSGEGMFKKEPNAVPAWSVRNVERCAERQKGILDCAASMLADGGRLAYSTCTFAEEEDEWQIADFLGRHAGFSLGASEKIYPHRQAGEGHYAALLLREGDGAAAPGKPFPVCRNRAANDAFARFWEEVFGAEQPIFGREERITTLPDGRMYLVPQGTPDLSAVRVLRLGVELGEWDGKRFKPAHALASAFGSRARRTVSLSREGSKRYLRGETVEADLSDGWCVVCVEEFPLGLGKCTDGVVKNHIPKALRLFS